MRTDVKAELSSVARCKVRSDEGINGTDQRWRTTNRANPGRRIRMSFMPMTWSSGET